MIRKFSVDLSDFEYAFQKLLLIWRSEASFDIENIYDCM